MPHHAQPRRRTALRVAAGSAAALAGLALWNNARARRSERAHPPVGRVAERGGLALHWIDTDPGGRGTQGLPVVLLHGNIVTLDDWIASGIVARLEAAGRRVVAFDRPGFGHSARGRGRAWRAREQAAHLRAATRALGIERAVVVGHSWAALVALAWALDAPEETAGLGLLSGYYHASPRADALVVAPAAAPGLGLVVRHTIAPLFARATLPGMLKMLFAPRPVPERFRALFPRDLVDRPSHLRATAEDGMIMVGDAEALRARLGELGGGARLPVLIAAGLGDRIVDPRDQAMRLARELPQAKLHLVPDGGHMIHHADPDAIAQAILALGEEAPPRALAAPGDRAGAVG